MNHVRRAWIAASLALAGDAVIWGLIILRSHA